MIDNPQAPETVVGVQLSWAIIAAYGIQYVKQLRAIPWINFEAQNLNRVFSVFVAAATGSGIYFTFSRSTGSLLITGITVSAVYHFVGHALQQFALQHAAYKALIAPNQPGVIQEEVRKNGVKNDKNATNGTAAPTVLGSTH